VQFARPTAPNGGSRAPFETFGTPNHEWLEPVASGPSTGDWPVAARSGEIDPKWTFAKAHDDGTTQPQGVLCLKQFAYPLLNVFVWFLR
jgi:hypothetical protein